jgi:hypothetical protein
MAALGMLGLLACSGPPRVNASTPADAEFLLVSDDSTIWVRASPETTVVRRAPVSLLLVENRLVELFVVEDAIDFPDASFLVEQLFRRDLLTGDSALVFADSAVIREAVAYMKAHPDAERLDPDDAPSEAARSVESSVVPMDAVAGMLGVEVHQDRMVGEYGTHNTFRVMVDLRTGRRLALGDILPAPAARAVQAAARTQLDSAIRLAATRGGAFGGQASRALASLQFDSLSFSLARSGDALAVQFLAHDEQVIDEARDTHRFALEPIPTSAVPTWWAAARDMLPRVHSDSVTRFSAASQSVSLRYDPEDIALVMAAVDNRFKTVTHMRGPVRRMIPLKRATSAADMAMRRALERAFTESGYVAQQVRAASLRDRARSTATHQAAL